MRRCRGQPDHVEDRAAADGDDVRVAVNVITINVRMNFRDMEVRVLGALAALNDKGRTDQSQQARKSGEVAFDVPRQRRLRPGQRFIEHHKHLVLFLALAVGQHLFERQVCRVKDASREQDAVTIADLNCALNNGHRRKVELWTREFEFYLSVKTRNS